MEGFHAREFLDGNLFTDTMVNNILGPAAVYDVNMENGRFEIARINEQGYRLAGLEVLNMNTSELTRKMWSSVRDDDRPVMLGLFERAYGRRATSTISGWTAGCCGSGCGCSSSGKTRGTGCIWSP